MVRFYVCMSPRPCTSSKACPASLSLPSATTAQSKSATTACRVVLVGRADGMPSGMIAGKIEARPISFTAHTRTSEETKGAKHSLRLTKQQLKSRWMRTAQAVQYPRPSGHPPKQSGSQAIVDHSPVKLSLRVRHRQISKTKCVHGEDLCRCAWRLYGGPCLPRSRRAPPSCTTWSRGPGTF